MPTSSKRKPAQSVAAETVLTLPRLHPGQLKVAEEAKRFNVCVMGRRFGKSFYCRDRLVHPALKGYPVAWFAPTNKILADSWREMKLAMAPITSSKSEDEHRIDLTCGGSIEMWSLESNDAGRSRRYKTIVVDEAGMVVDLKRCWEENIRPTLSDFKGDAWLVGCVTGDTRLVTEDGMLTISELSPLRTPGEFDDSLDLDVAGFNGQPQNATAFYCSGYGPTVKMRTRAGFGLEATPIHPVWVMGEDGFPKWVESSKVKVGDHVAIRRGARIWGNRDSLSGFSDIDLRSKSRRCSKSSSDLELKGMSPDLAYLMGLILGDGYVDFGRTCRVTIAHSPEEGETIEFLRGGNSIGAVFHGYNADKYHSRITSRRLVEFLRWYGFSQVKASMKRIPNRLWGASEGTVVEFLKGLFDADGSVHANRRVVNFTSSSAGLIDDVQQLLLNLGVVARKSAPRITPPTNRVSVESTAFRLEISGVNFKLFMERVGFRLTRKAHGGGTSSPSESQETRRDYIPNQLNLIQRVKRAMPGKGRGKHRPVNCTQNMPGAYETVGYGKLREFCCVCSGSSDLDAISALKSRVEENYFWDKVVSVENSEAETFDLVVPTTHAFVSNGWISHNTPRGYNYFKTLFDRGQDPSNKEWKSWQMPTYSNPFIDPSEVDSARADMTEASFNQEYLALFVNWEGAVFRNVYECATASPASLPIPGHEVVIGVDWGRSRDYTVFTVIDRTDRRMLYMDRSNKVDYALQRGRLAALRDIWKPVEIVAESNSIGQPIIEQLEKDGIRVRAFQTTNASKNQAIEHLALAFERKEIQILNDPTLTSELLSFQGEQLPSGTIRYAASEGSHDDTVMSLAMAWTEVSNPLTLGLLTYAQEENMHKVERSSHIKPATSPASTLCPRCESKSVAYIAGSLHCNQCGNDDFGNKVEVDRVTFSDLGKIGRGGNVYARFR